MVFVVICLCDLLYDNSSGTFSKDRSRERGSNKIPPVNGGSIKNESITTKEGSSMKYSNNIATKADDANDGSVKKRVTKILKEMHMTEGKG